MSLFAIQFAKLFGAGVIATTSTEAKAAGLRRAGADHVVNYRDVPQWSDAVRAITDGRGVDHVVEVGGMGTLEQSLKSAAFDGQTYFLERDELGKVVIAMN